MKASANIKVLSVTEFGTLRDPKGKKYRIRVQLSENGKTIDCTMTKIVDSRLLDVFDPINFALVTARNYLYSGQMSIPLDIKLLEIEEKGKTVTKKVRVKV